MVPHLHIGPVSGLAIVLFIIAVFGSLRLLALKYQDRSTVAQAWLLLF